MAEKYKGINYPKKLYDSIMQAIHDVGGVRATDVENAGNIDELYARHAALKARADAGDSYLQTIELRLRALESQVLYLELGDGTPFTGSGADQVLPHTLGAVPKLVVLVPVTGDATFTTVGKTEATVTVQVDSGAKYRVFLFR